MLLRIAAPAALVVAALLAQTLACSAATAQSTTRPNVIVVLTDDQGWGDLRLHGNLEIETPHLDALAAAGARFQHFYVSPVCSPTRAELLTGRHHVRSGVYHTSAGGERIDLDETLISELFQRSGYRTAGFGKWHSGMQFPYHPLARGFDHFYGFCSGHWGNYFSPMLERDGHLTTGEGFLVDDLTNQAMEFIDEHRAENFFVYLPLNTPHSPMQVPDRWWNKFKDNPLEQLPEGLNEKQINHARAALAMCENIDWNVGRLLERLDQLQLAEDTIVVFFCDNGPNGSRYNGGLRGRKGSTDEGGVRSPLFIRWPEKIPAGTHIEAISSAMDLLPTLCELADVPIAGANELDGRSLVPLLRGSGDAGSAKDWPPRTLVHTWRGRVSVRSDRYRLDHQGRLYDIDADPGQQHAIDDQPETLAALQQEADRFRQTMLARHGAEFDLRPFVVGHPDAPLTQLPARDAEAHGGIVRSNRFPNDSFFSGWTSTEDAITWDCVVDRAGRYQVELLYTCPPEDVGATVELSFGNSRTVGRVSEPHESPLVGREHDRVERMESYTKDWGRMRLGEIELAAGPGRLQLKALEIPGSQVMDLRLMLLTPQPETQTP
ncbi:arylsulfatase [Roseimaritima sediminicola]|uniref:arylsulfatase n=1 Tax=Roseimaritima sediminicola TaxID=2662066 RepID=UPI0036F2BD67